MVSISWNCLFSEPAEFSEVSKKMQINCIKSTAAICFAHIFKTSAHYWNLEPILPYYVEQNKSLVCISVILEFFFYFLYVYTLNNVFCEFKVVPAENDFLISNFPLWCPNHHFLPFWFSVKLAKRLPRSNSSSNNIKRQ